MSWPSLATECSFPSARWRMILASLVDSAILNTDWHRTTDEGRAWSISVALHLMAEEAL